MYLDTANLNEIELSLKTGVIQGITTNPTILEKEKKPRLEQVDSIMRLNPKILYVQVIGYSVEELVEDFKMLVDYAKNKNYNLGIKVPISFIGLEAVRQMKIMNPEILILGTAIYSSDQVILSSLAGCDFVAPYVNRMQNNGINSFEEIGKMRDFIDSRNLKTQILAASFKNTSQITDSLISGAHTCTIPFDLLKQMMDKELALSAIKVFNEQGIKLG